MDRALVPLRREREGSTLPSPGARARPHRRKRERSISRAGGGRRCVAGGGRGARGEVPEFSSEPPNLRGARFARFNPSLRSTRPRFAATSRFAGARPCCPGPASRRPREAAGLELKRPTRLCPGPRGDRGGVPAVLALYRRYRGEELVRLQLFSCSTPTRRPDPLERRLLVAGPEAAGRTVQRHLHDLLALPRDRPRARGRRRGPLQPPGVTRPDPASPRGSRRGRLASRARYRPGPAPTWDRVPRLHEDESLPSSRRKPACHCSRAGARGLPWPSAWSMAGAARIPEGGRLVSPDRPLHAGLVVFAARAGLGEPSPSSPPDSAQVYRRTGGGARRTRGASSTT